MARSTLINENYNNGVSGIDYTGTTFNRYTKSAIPNNPTNGYIQTTGSVLRFFNGNPAPDPWGSFFSNYNSEYVDLTLNLASARYFDNRLGFNMAVRGTWSGNSIGAPSNSIVVRTDAVTGTLTIQSLGATRQSISHVCSFPSTYRFLLDSTTRTLTVYVNGVVLTSYTFAPAEYPSTPGGWGMWNYGPWNYDFNAITLKGDRRDNFILV